MQSFCVDEDGTLFALNANRDLRTLAPGSREWTTLASGVQSLMKSPQGSIYVLSESGELQRYRGDSRWTTLDRGVQSLAMVEDGAIYELNDRGEFKRLREHDREIVLVTGVVSFQVAPEGEVYALNNRQELMRLTARDHWTVIEQRVSSFQIAPNGDLYLIGADGELRRQKVGYSWMTLQRGVERMTIYSDGSVYAFDAAGKRTVYSSLGPYFLLSPIVDPEALEALDPPSDDEVVRAANIFSPQDQQLFAPGPMFPLSNEAAAADAYYWGGGGLGNAAPALPRLTYSSVTYAIPELLTVHNVRIVKDSIPPQAADPPRWVPSVGLMRLHRVQYKCTIFYTTEENVDGQLTVFIDHDHFHFVDQ